MSTEMTETAGASGRKPRRLQVAAAVLFSLLGAVLLTVGIVQAATTAYLIGLASAAVALALWITLVPGVRRRWVAVPTAILVVAAVVSAGVLIPRASLDAEFDGDGVAWRVSGVGSGYGVALVTAGVVVLRDTDGTVDLRSTADGRPLGEITANSGDSILGAGPNVLIEPAPGIDTSVRLYGPDGTLRWELPVPDNRLIQALAHADDVTVLELCLDDGCHREGIGPAGEVVWESSPTAYLGDGSISAAAGPRRTASPRRLAGGKRRGRWR